MFFSSLHVFYCILQMLWLRLDAQNGITLARAAVISDQYEHILKTMILLTKICVL